LALPVKLTARGACPEVGEADAVAASGTVDDVAVMETDLLEVAETLSVTVRVAV